MSIPQQIAVASLKHSQPNVGGGGHQMGYSTADCCGLIEAKPTHQPSGKLLICIPQQIAVASLKRAPMELVKIFASVVFHSRLLWPH